MTSTRIFEQNPVRQGVSDMHGCMQGNLGSSSVCVPVPTAAMAFSFRKLSRTENITGEIKELLEKEPFSLCAMRFVTDCFLLTEKTHTKPGQSSK